MWKILILLVKIFVLSLPYFLLLGIANVILMNVGRLFSVQRYLALFYSILVTIVFIYLYSLWGAYFSSLVSVYSEINGYKWFLMILCASSILTWLRFVNKQLKEENLQMNSMADPLTLESYSGQRIYMKSLTIVALSMVIALPVSFVVFLFTDTLQEAVFFGIPEYFAKLWL